MHVQEAEQRVGCLSSERVREAQEQLLVWFGNHAADLPWRHNPSPYDVLVSEFMLQQTQRDRVAPRFIEFVRQFPTPEALAKASTAAVIRAWSGLGYNGRAVRLQLVARSLVAGGHTLCSDLTVLRSLPGVGAYTAGAVACFGFGVQTPFVDTNIRRVLRRVFLGDPHPEAIKMLDERLAERLLPDCKAVEWNSALMDLGATICRSKAPRCPVCPLAGPCLAKPLYYPTDAGSVSAVAEARTQYMPVRPRTATKLKSGSSYAGSTRQLRGRIVEALRSLVDGEWLHLADLVLRASGMGLPGDSDRVEELAERMAREGIVAAHDGEGGERLYALPE